MRSRGDGVRGATGAALLDGRSGSLCMFDLSDAIGPMIACARASGMDVTSPCLSGIAVEGQLTARRRCCEHCCTTPTSTRHGPRSRFAPRSPRAVWRCSTSKIAARGIAGPLSERVFERGVCGADSAGSGLGLFIARRLMPNRAGRSPSAPDPGEAHHSRPFPLPAMNGRVLVVEDHSLVAIGLQLALSAQGLGSGHNRRPDSQRIVEHANQFQPQCVLLDIGLGETVGSGIALIAPLLRDRSPSGDAHRRDPTTVLASCLEAGAAGWIGKDAFLDEVVATIATVLAGTPLIGCAAREAMIEELRIERAGRLRALSPFERLTLPNAKCSPCSRRPLRGRDRRHSTSPSPPSAPRSA